MKTRNIVGNVPDPDELYGRQELIDHLWRQIEGNNVLLLGPRRFGKTGVMGHVLDRPKHGYLPFYLDLEDVDSPVEFSWRLTKALLSQNRLRSVLQTVRGLPAVVTNWAKETFDEAEFEGAKVKFKESISESWRETARKLVVELEKADPTLIFVFDELPAMLENVARKHGDDEARNFLAWFRTIRLERKDKLRRHRFIVGGSIGIDVILRRLDADDKLNDFERLAVEPISDEEALRLAAELAESLDVAMSDELGEGLLELIGSNVPYFIHLFFSQLGQLPAAKRRPLTRETLEAVYEQRVVGPTCKHYFDHYRSRLSRYGKLRQRRALAILGAVAAQGKVSASALFDVYAKPSKRDTSEHDFNELMADLECEWYLMLDTRTNEYYFMVNVMRDWWQRWYGSVRKKRPSAKEK
jgi:hypothetical protein